MQSPCNYQQSPSGTSKTKEKRTQADILHAQLREFIPGITARQTFLKQLQIISTDDLNYLVKVVAAEAAEQEQLEKLAQKYQEEMKKFEEVLDQAAQEQISCETPGCDKHKCLHTWHYCEVTRYGDSVSEPYAVYDDALCQHCIRHCNCVNTREASFATVQQPQRDMLLSSLSTGDAARWIFAQAKVEPEVKVLEYVYTFQSDDNF